MKNEKKTNNKMKEDEMKKNWFIKIFFNKKKGKVWRVNNSTERKVYITENVTFFSNIIFVFRTSYLLCYLFAEHQKKILFCKYFLFFFIGFHLICLKFYWKFYLNLKKKMIQKLWKKKLFIILKEKNDKSIK